MFKNLIPYVVGFISVISPLTLLATSAGEVEKAIVFYDDNVLWSQSFAEVDGSVSTDSPSNPWVAIHSSGKFNVQNEVLTIQGGGSEGIFSSYAIKTSGTPVRVNLDLESEGRLESDQDYVRVFVKIDGGQEQLIAEKWGVQEPTTISVDNLVGSSLELIIRAYVSYRTEYYFIDNISVTGANIQPNPEPEPEPDPLDNVHPDIIAIIDIDPSTILRTPRSNWADSYSVGDHCFCDTTYDHDIADIVVGTSEGEMTVRAACELLGPGPGSRGNPLYNDVQCGNGPAGNVDDENYCPGRVELGREGCVQQGPTWKFPDTEQEAPLVDAGADVRMIIGDVLYLSGTVTDDNLPAGTLISTWSKSAGPGIATFGDTSAADTTVTFSAPGTYTLTLTGDDGALTTSASLEVTVEEEAIVNMAPVVVAGADVTVDFGDGLELSGAVTDDNLPAGTLISTWSKSAGPGTATFGNTRSVVTTVTFSAPGTYTMTLTGDDGELSTSDTLEVTVEEVVANGPDADNDGNSDSTDLDDDNDSTPDASDPFALDGQNGRSTSLPLLLSFNTDHGFIGQSGFSGLMSNGSDYSALYNPTQFEISNGALTVFDVPDGDPYKSRNTQQFAFQAGIDVNTSSDPFIVRTRILNPFEGVASPEKYQSMGLFIGTGDQDNYIKLVVNSQGPQGGLEFSKETNGNNFQNVNRPTASIYGTDWIDLMLLVDPTAGTVQASYQTTNGSKTPLSATASLPAGWLSGVEGLAVGIISTSFNTEPFDVSWDYLEVVYDDTDPTTNSAPVVNAGSDATLVIDDVLDLSGTITDDGLPTETLIRVWSQSTGSGTAIFGDTSAMNTTVTFSTPGTYTLTLNADDGELSMSDTVEVTVVDTTSLHPDIVSILDIDPSTIIRTPQNNWADSYSVGDRCFCETTYDHDIADVIASTEIGEMTVRAACELIGPGPGSQGNPLYNDVQCGNGPPNSAGDEDYCPGRVELGKAGCVQQGPTWNFTNIGQ